MTAPTFSRQSHDYQNTTPFPALAHNSQHSAIPNMLSGHAGASLLHLNRPTQLNAPTAPPRLEVVVNDDEPVTDGPSQVACE